MPRYTGGGAAFQISPLPEQRPKYSYVSTLYLPSIDLQLWPHAITQDVALITVQDLPALVAEPFSPDAVAAGSEDRVRVERVLERLVEAPQRAVVPAVGLGDLIGEESGWVETDYVNERASGCRGKGMGE